MTNTISTQKMDWHLLWTALAVIIPVMATTISCFLSLSRSIDKLENRLSKIETVLIVKNIMPKELLATNEEN